MADQFSGRVFRGWKSPGIDSNWVGQGRKRMRGSRENEGRERERGDSLGHWLQTPWRRRDASQLLAKHTLSRRIRGRLVFLWLPPGRSHWFQHPGNPHKISSPPRSTARDIPCYSSRVSRSFSSSADVFSSPLHHSLSPRVAFLRR